MFKKITSPEPVVTYLYETISSKLKSGQKVFWLVPGGSAIALVVSIGERLVKDNVPVSNLTVTLTDERFGEVGHADSNWKQLGDSGFTLPGANLYPVLAGKDMRSTIADFTNLLQKQLSEADYRIGFFGIGPDGHTSGILPASSAVVATELVHGYDGGTYQRITTTPAALVKLDEAVAYAAGEAKWPIIDQLDTDLPIDKQPAQILKKIPKLTIFNDHKGESA